MDSEMRLSEIQREVQKAKEVVSLILRGEEGRVNPINLIREISAIDFRYSELKGNDYVRALSRYPLIGPYIERLRINSNNFHIQLITVCDIQYFRYAQELLVTIEEILGFSNTYNKLFKAHKNIIQLNIFTLMLYKLESELSFVLLLPSPSELEGEKTLHVKIPQRLTIDEYSDILSKLNKGIQQNPMIPITEVKLQFVEYGSTWMAILVDTSIVAIALSKLVSICLESPLMISEIRKNNSETKKNKAETEKIEVENMLKNAEVIDSEINKVLDYLDREQNEKYKGKLREIAASMDKNRKLKTEEFERFKYSVECLIEVLKSGVEIYPSATLTTSNPKELTQFPKKEDYKRLHAKKNDINDSGKAALNTDN